MSGSDQINDAGQPDGGQPDAVQRDTVQPDAVQPDAVQPDGGPSADRHESVKISKSGDATSGRDGSTFSDASKPAAAKTNPYPIYAPRFWHGMRPATWFGLLRSGRFRVHPRRLSTAASITLATPVNTLFAGAQSLLFQRSLANMQLHGSPVFILGHWRSGTTLLHELLVRDERLSSPSTFQCFCPHHFLVTEWVFRRFLWWLLPGKRPMDNMAAGWDRPQEDEFALMNLGLPSPYRRIAFPNDPPADLDYLDFEGVDEDQVTRWLMTLRRFLTAVSKSTGRPLVIKSPTHTGRIAYLAREFPEAKFIHITRDPLALFPSTCRLWRSLDEVQALQVPTGENIEDYVITCLQRMYRAFERQRQQVDPARIVDIRYEDLTADPVATLKKVYDELRLSDFETVQPIIEAWAESEHRRYQANRLTLDRETETRVRNAWHDYFQRYGYE